MQCHTVTPSSTTLSSHSIASWVCVPTKFTSHSTPNDEFYIKHVKQCSIRERRTHGVGDRGGAHGANDAGIIVGRSTQVMLHYTWEREGPP